MKGFRAYSSKGDKNGANCTVRFGRTTLVRQTWVKTTKRARALLEAALRHGVNGSPSKFDQCRQLPGAFDHRQAVCSISERLRACLDDSSKTPSSPGTVERCWSCWLGIALADIHLN